jgi:hypothetical protein
MILLDSLIVPNCIIFWNVAQFSRWSFCWHCAEISLKSGVILCYHFTAITQHHKAIAKPTAYTPLMIYVYWRSTPEIFARDGLKKNMSLAIHFTVNHPEWPQDIFSEISGSVSQLLLALCCFVLSGGSTTWKQTYVLLGLYLFTSNVDWISKSSYYFSIGLVLWAS